MLGLGARATGGAILGLRGECRIVVRAWARFRTGLGSVERVEKVATCLGGACQFIGDWEKAN